MKKKFLVYLIKYSTQVICVDAENEEEAERIANDGLDTNKYKNWDECQPEVDCVEPCSD